MNYLNSCPTCFNNACLTFFKTRNSGLILFIFIFFIQTVEMAFFCTNIKKPVLQIAKQD